MRLVVDPGKQAIAIYDVRYVISLAWTYKVNGDGGHTPFYAEPSLKELGQVLARVDHVRTKDLTKHSTAD